MTAKKKPAAKADTHKKTVKRTVASAAAGVEAGAERTRDLGAAVVRAGLLLEQSAAVLDSIAQRAKKPRAR